MNSEKQIFHLKKSEIFIPLGIFLFLAFFFTIPIFFHFSYWGIEDWDQHLFYHAVPRKTLLEYHQIPLWNPYYCGGTVMLANPQSRVLSPTFFLILLFGEVKGIKLDIWLHLVIGMMGMYRLARHFKLGKIASYLPSFVYILSSMYALNLTVGMTWFLSVAYLPWAFLFYLKSFQKFRFATLCGLFLVFIYFDGGAYTLSITILFFLLFSLFQTIEIGFAKTAKIISFTLIFMLFLGAIKFFPSIVFLREHPRQITDYSGFSIKVLAFSLFSRDQSVDAFERFEQKKGFWDGISYKMDENGMYIGFIPFFLFLLGIFFYWKRQWKLLLCFFMFLWLSFGNRIPLGLWELIHTLPVYNFMRVAQRFRIIFFLFMALFSGFGLLALKDYIIRRLSKPILANLTEFVVLGIILVDLMLVNSPVFKEAFPIPPLETKQKENFYQVSKLPNYDKNGLLPLGKEHLYSSWSGMYPAMLSNIGTVDGYESANVPRKAKEKDSTSYKGEVFLEGTEGRVFIKSWSPNKIVVEADVSEEGYLVLNQNFYTGWRAKAEKKREVISFKGLSAVKVFPQDKVIELRYLPMSFIFGSILSCITALWCIIIPIRRHKS